MYVLYIIGLLVVILFVAWNNLRTVYVTIGMDCEHFRFWKEMEVPGGYCVWQRIHRKAFLWFPVGQQIREHECNYLKLSERKAQGK